MYVKYAYVAVRITRSISVLLIQGKDAKAFIYTIKNISSDPLHTSRGNERQAFVEQVRILTAIHSLPMPLYFMLR